MKKYTKQSMNPEWYGNCKINLSAVAGTSSSNEWYGFDSRAEAIEALSNNVSQSFIDQFEKVDGEIYYSEDVEWSDDLESLIIKKGATPADLNDVVFSQSKF